VRWLYLVCIFVFDDADDAVSNFCGSYDSCEILGGWSSASEIPLDQPEELSSRADLRFDTVRKKTPDQVGDRLGVVRLGFRLTEHQDDRWLFPVRCQGYSTGTPPNEPENQSSPNPYSCSVASSIAATSVEEIAGMIDAPVSGSRSTTMSSSGLRRLTKAGE